MPILIAVYSFQFISEQFPKNRKTIVGCSGKVRVFLNRPIIVQIPLIKYVFEPGWAGRAVRTTGQQTIVSGPGRRCTGALYICYQEFGPPLVEDT